MNARPVWPAPSIVGRRAYPSTIFFVPTASGGMAIRRIVGQLLRGEYHEYRQLALWKNGDLSCAGTREWPWQRDGQLYHVTMAEPLAQWFDEAHIDTGRQRLILTIRDPRDSIISLYHLTNEPVHAAATAGLPVAASYDEEAARVRACTLEEYVAERFVSQLHGLRAIRALAERLRPENVCFLSYAQLCEAFPTYLQRLIDFLQIRPAPSVVADLLATEDVRYKDRLNPRSLSHCTNAAPMPGRHKRELQADTIARITRESSDILEWLAQHELPELSHIYLDGTPA